MKSKIILLLILFSTHLAFLHAQIPTYEAYLINDVQTAPNQYEFDIYVKRIGSVPFEAYGLQCALIFEESIRNGGTFSAMYLQGTSEMNSEQIPSDPSLAFHSGNKCTFKLAARTVLNPGTATIISSVGYGTRLGRFRITTSADKFAPIRPNLQWTFDQTTYGYATKFAAYVYNSVIIVDITNQGSHKSQLSNPILLPIANLMYEAKIINNFLTAPNQYEFDIYVKQTDSVQIEVYSLQCALLFDEQLSNGGNLSAIYVPGTSEMNSFQIPNDPDFTSIVSGKRVFKLAGVIAPSAGSGTILSSAGNGTRLGRFRISTTTASFKYLQSNITWAFDSSVYGYATNFQSFINNSPSDITIHQFHQGVAVFNNYSYEAKLINDVVVLDNTYEFDIYVKRTSSIPLKVHSLQCALTFDDSIRSGGNLSLIYIPGTSTMNTTQIPGNPDIQTIINGKRVVKISGIIPPSPYSGTILSDSGNGTRLGRFRLTTSSASFDYRRANLNWIFDTALYDYTNKFVAYIDNIPFDITDSTMHINALVNPLLNQSGVPYYEARLMNDLFIPPNQYEFDIYVRRTGVVPFEVYGLQHCLILNNLILNGGTPTLTYIPGTSQMNAAQVPSNTFNLATVMDGKRVIKMPARIPSGPGAGTIISNTSDGTRFGRFRLATTATTFALYWPDFSWNFNQSPYGYATKYHAYVNGVPHDVTNPSFHINELGNPPLPVDIVSFTGSATKNFISLEWTTSTEINSKGFEIQRKLSITSPR